MTRQEAYQPIDHEKSAAESSTDRLRNITGTATDKLKEASEDAQEFADTVGRQVREYGEKAQDAARQFKPFVQKSLKEQPMTTLAGAAVIGFLLGALWKK